MTGEVEQQKRIGTNGQEPTCMCHCPSTSTVWVGTSDGPLVVYRTGDATQIAECMLHESGVTSLLFVHARWLWSAGSDGRIAVWDTAKCTVVRCFHACPRGPVNCLAVVGSLGVAANGDEEGAICIWPFERSSASKTVRRDPSSAVHASTEREEPVLTHKGAHASTVLSLCSVAAAFLWSGSEDGSVRVWTVDSPSSSSSSSLSSSSASLKLVTTLRCHNAAVHCITKEPAGNRVWTASLDGRLALWDGDRQSLLTQLPVSYPPRGNHFIFSVAPVAVATAQRMWSCSTDGTVRSWLSICPNSSAFAPSTVVTIQQPPPSPPPPPQRQQHVDDKENEAISLAQHQLETDELYHRFSVIESQWARGFQFILQDACVHWKDLMQLLRERANAFAEETEEEIESLRKERGELNAGLTSERKYRLQLQNEAETHKVEMESRMRELQRRSDEEARNYQARQQAFGSEQARIQRTIDEQERAIVSLRDSLNSARDDNMNLSRKNEKLSLELQSWETRASELAAEVRSVAALREHDVAKLQRELERTLNALSVQEATNERAFARAGDAELEKAEVEMELASTNRKLASCQQQLRDSDRDYKAHVRKLDSVVDDLRAQLSSHQGEVADLRSVNSRLEGDLEREKASLRSLRQSSDDEIRSLTSKNAALRDDLDGLRSACARHQDRVAELEATVQRLREAHDQQLSDSRQQSDVVIGKLRQEVSHLQLDAESQRRSIEELRLSLDEHATALERERERNRELRTQAEEQQRTLGELQRAASSSERRAAALSSELETCRAAADRHSADLRETLKSYSDLQEKFSGLARRAQDDAIALRESRDEAARLQNECRRLREQSNNLQSQVRDNESVYSDRLQKELRATGEASARCETLEQNLRLTKQQLEELASALATERSLRSDAEGRLRATREEKVVDQQSTDSLVQDLKAQLQMEREAAGRNRAQMEQLAQEHALLARDLTAAKEKASRLERENTLEQASGSAARERLQHTESSLDQARDELRQHRESSFKETATLKRKLAVLEAERDSAARVLEEQHGEIARLREQLHHQAGDLVRRSKELGVYAAPTISSATSPMSEVRSRTAATATATVAVATTPRREAKSYHDPIPASYMSTYQPSSPEIPVGGYRVNSSVASNQSPARATSAGSFPAGSAGGYPYYYANTNSGAGISSSGVVTPMWSPQPRI